MDIILNLHDDNIVVMNIKLFVVQEQLIVYILIPKMNNYGLQIIEFMTQILTRKQKQKSVEEMILNAINNKKIPFKTVLMDSWYATQRLMGLIDNLGKIYYCPLKSNRAR